MLITFIIVTTIFLKIVDFSGIFPRIVGVEPLTAQSFYKVTIIWITFSFLL